MFERIRLKKAFFLRIMTAMLAALFVIPAYLFYSAPQLSPTIASAQRSPVALEHTIQAHSTRLNTFPAELAKSEIQGRIVPGVRPSKQAEVAADKESIASLLAQLLQDYHSTELDPDQKRAIRSMLPEISRSKEGRELITNLFFHKQDPEMAASMYDMILDAKLKDTSLIVELIERDATEFHSDYKARLIDLIADHNTLEQPYKQKIEDFLADMALHSDEHVRQAATAQWAWYVQHHKGILPVMDAYLFNHASQVRQEIYEMIELGAIQNEAEKTDLALALDSLLYADYLELAAEEKTRIHKLKAQLYP